jgi:hypothetical protein
MPETNRAEQSWTVRNKARLLVAIMEKLAGDARISFEGDMGHTRLFKCPGASQEETAILKRNTLYPMQEFVVVPLEANMPADIMKAIGGTVPRTILHIQIEKAGVLELVHSTISALTVLFLDPALGVILLRHCWQVGS